MENSYLKKEQDKWYCLLPGHIYKEIPYVGLVDVMDWDVFYYDVYDAITLGILTDFDLIDLDLDQIFSAIGMDFLN